MHTVHFVGGPLDGETHAFPEPPAPLILFPVAPFLRALELDGAAPLELSRVERIVYASRPGVVAGEAVYDYQP